MPLWLSQKLQLQQQSQKIWHLLLHLRL